MTKHRERLNRILDIGDYILCNLSRRFPTWHDALSNNPVRLYAGKLRRGLPQYTTHYGITPFYASSKNIIHDVLHPYPIPDNSVDLYQSEDVFEHLPLDRQVSIFDEIYRILKPGGLFRLSLPDYNCDIYSNRSIKNAKGEFIFDPAGGGRVEEGEVLDGGHLWFPTIDLVRELFLQSQFSSKCKLDYLHYTEPNGKKVMKPINYSLGHIQRTPDYDMRVKIHPRPISIVVDAWKVNDGTFNGY